MSPQNSAILNKYRLSALEPALDRVALPTVAVQPVDQEIKGVVSKFGGMPDLPPDFVWPVNGLEATADGEPALGRKLDFLIQIRLDELPDIDVAYPLPNTGLLSFFYDIEEQPWGFDPIDRYGSKVVYTPTLDGLVSFEAPDEEIGVNEVAVNFETFTIYPDLYSDEFLEVNELKEMSREESERYADFRKELADRAIGAHRLLGYPDLIQNDMHTEVQLVSNGIYMGRPSDDPRIEELSTGAADWILLLQIASDNSLRAYWGDAGNLYFWIRKQDLLSLNFDNTMCILQCY